MSPEAIITAAAEQDEIVAAVRALPEHERDAIVLYYIDGYSQHQIAGFLEVSAPAVRKRLQRGRDHLRSIMADWIRRDLQQHRPSKDETFVRMVQLATTLDEAAMEAQLDMLEAALVDGIDVDAVGAGGQTLLHWAARRGNLEAVRLLLHYGANPRSLDRQARTPTRAALDAGHTEVAALLECAERQNAPDGERS